MTIKLGGLSEESGMSLIEVMVTIAILGIVTSVGFAAVFSGASSLKAVRQTNDLNEESRLVLNRISRELREASLIVGATNPDASNISDGSPRICPSSPPPCFNPDSDVSLTFEADFNRDGTIDPNASDPERLTYKYDRSNRRLLLQTSTESTPILAANVDGFKITYRSSESRCDMNYDGSVTWQELESAPSPPCPSNVGSVIGGVSALDFELPHIDQVTVDLTVLTPPRQQQYRTKIDLRNRS